MKKNASQNGWVMTHKPIATNIKWSSEYVDIPSVLTTSSESSLTDIQASCTNTDKITAQGDSSKYPAAWVAKNYKEGDKTWCLPSAGLLRTALQNVVNFTEFNDVISKIQASAGTSAATILGSVSSGYEHIWSSSENSYNYVWYLYTRASGIFKMGYDYKDNNFKERSVRPVFAF